jgi:hypothetical protein
VRRRAHRGCHSALARPEVPHEQRPRGVKSIFGAQAGGCRFPDCPSGPRFPPGRATDREVGVIAAVLVTDSEMAAAHRVSLSHLAVKHHLQNVADERITADMAQSAN